MVWKLFLWSSLRKSYSIYLENSDLAKLWPFKTKIWPFFGKNWLFWEFLTYSFQTQLWIFLIFGMELLWILTLFGEPIILCLVAYKFTLVRAYVRTCVRVFRSYSRDRSIFFLFYFLHEVVSSYDLDDHQNFFCSKNFWPPKWPKMVKTWPFLGKIAIFECFWPISSKHR